MSVLQQKPINKGVLKMFLPSKEEWKYAEDFFFKIKPSLDSNVIIKIEKNKHISHDFISVNDEVMVIVNQETLGEGSFGKVMLCQNKDTIFFALKVLKNASEENDMTRIEEEILSSLNYLIKSCLMHTIDCSGIKKEIHYVHLLKYLGIDFSKKYIKSKENISLIEAAKLFKKLSELHNSGYLHRDIKPDNVTIDSKKKVHLIDFGCSVSEKSEQLKGVVGTIVYMREDLLGGQVDHSKDTDIHSAIKLLFFAEIHSISKLPSTKKNQKGDVISFVREWNSLFNKRLSECKNNPISIYCSDDIIFSIYQNYKNKNYDAKKICTYLVFKKIDFFIKNKEKNHAFTRLKNDAFIACNKFFNKPNKKEEISHTLSLESEESFEIIDSNQSNISNSFIEL